MIINAFFIGVSFGFIFGLATTWKPKLTIGILFLLFLLCTITSEAEGVSVFASTIPTVEIIAEIVGTTIGAFTGFIIGTTI